MKKILSVTFLVSGLVLVSGVALAATPVKYSSAQQTCIRTAQGQRAAATKTATDALNAATTNALETRQDATKTARDALTAATKVAQKTRQDAITAAAKLTDPKAKTAAIKAAQDAYNNDAAVKKSQAAYQAAIKSANDAYNNDATVKTAKIPFNAATKAANVKFQSDLKACMSGSAGDVQNLFQKIFKNFGASISGAFPDLSSIFQIKK